MQAAQSQVMLHICTGLSEPWLLVYVISAASQGQIQDFLGKPVPMYKHVGFFFLLILSHFSQISHENEIIWSH